MPPELHEGFVCGVGLGGHGDHLNAVIVAGLGVWVTSHGCFEDGSPRAKVERKVWAGCSDPVCELIEELAVQPEGAVRSQ